MIYELLAATARAQPERLFIADAVGEVTYGQALDQAHAFAGAFRGEQVRRAYFYAADSALLATALVATDLAGVEACVLNREQPRPEVEETVASLGEGGLFTDAETNGWTVGDVWPLAAIAGEPTVEEAPDAAAGGRIVILTTGTTGRPKPVLYTWDRLAAQIRLMPGGDDTRWLLAYPLNHFAGVQMLLHVLLNKAILVVPPTRRMEDVVGAAARYGVDSISATPTFWRFFTGLLMGNEALAVPLKRITLGGEASTPEVLERLRRLFPEASISQVYATTELGSCFSVRDGLPGFPREYLGRPVGNVELRVVDGELHVKSPYRMVGYLSREQASPPGDWVATGDLVEVVGDRVLFRGRKSETINVGGIKVYPLKVEAAILRAEGVRAVRAYGRPNAIAGQIVAADVEVAEGADAGAVLARVREICRADLSRYEQPRDLRVVEALARQNEKIVRRA